ncbi:MAG: hypothetical protein JRN57_01140 [Nitrososphaerota archaeon]|nr:hypothetical protein [Nitrososphaerota archaeon]
MLQVGAAAFLLYAAHRFYLQFLLVVWGAAVMAGIAIYERRAVGWTQVPKALAEAGRLVELRQRLAAIEEELSASSKEEDARHLRAWKGSAEQGIRKTGWSVGESGLEDIQSASGPDGMGPLPPRGGPGSGGASRSASGVTCWIRSTSRRFWRPSR